MPMYVTSHPGSYQRPTKIFTPRSCSGLSGGNFQGGCIESYFVCIGGRMLAQPERALTVFFKSIHLWIGKHRPPGLCLLLFSGELVSESMDPKLGALLCFVCFFARNPQPMPVVNKKIRYLTWFFYVCVSLRTSASMLYGRRSFASTWRQI